MSTANDPGTPTRRGLSKLRGEAAAPEAPTGAPEVIPGVPDAPEPPAENVTLTKPAVAPAVEPVVEAPPETPPARRRGKGLPAALIALLAAVVVLLVLVIGYADRFSSPKKPAAAATSGGTPDERLAAVRAARQFTVSFFTYDYRKIDAYFTRIQAASTGDFRKDFVSKEKTLKTVVTQLKTVATGQVPDAGAGLSTLDGDRATALVAANFNASNAVTKNGQKRYRIKITMQRIKGAWLVTNLDQVI